MRPFGKGVKSAGCALVIWALLLPAAARSAEAPDIAGTLPEDYLPVLKPILERAAQRSPQTMAAEIEVALSEARVYGANAPRLSQLDAFVNAAGNQTAVSGANGTQSRDQGLFYSVTLNQALFHWGALKNQSAIAAINVLIAQRSYEEAYRALALTLRQSFLALVAKKVAVVQARHALGLLETNLAVERERFSQGLVSQGQVTQRELAAREARLQAARLEADFAGDRRRFARIAGMGELAEDAIPAEIPKPAFSSALAATVRNGLERDGGRSVFEVKVAELGIRAAELRYEIEKVRLRPKINASAGTSLDNATTAIGDTVTQQAITRQSVAVSARWYLFDGLATRGAKIEATTTKRQQERRLAAATEEALEQARNLEQQLAIDAEAVEISEIHRGIAETVLKQASQEFSLGNVPKVSVTGAEARVLSGATALAGARAVLLSRWSELVSLAGLDPVLKILPRK